MELPNTGWNNIKYNNETIRGGWCGSNYRFMYSYWIFENEVVISRRYQWSQGKESEPPVVCMTHLDAEMESIQKHLADAENYEGVFIVPGPEGFTAEWSLVDGKVRSQKFQEPEASITRRLDRWLSEAIKKGERLKDLPAALKPFDR